MGSYTIYLYTFFHILVIGEGRCKTIESGNDIFSPLMYYTYCNDILTKITHVYAILTLGCDYKFP
jgi:hypothetical protein